MKKLYEFSLDKVEIKDIEEKIQNEDGTTTIIPRKDKVTTPIKFFIKKPTRSLYDELELFQSRTYKEAVQIHGLIPKALLAKRISEDEGMLSSKDKEHIEQIQKNYIEVQKKLIELNDKKNPTPDELVEVAKIKEEGIRILMEIEGIRYAQESIYSNTAEAYVNRRVSRWLILYLSYNDDGSLVFGNADYAKRTEKFYEMDDSEDEFTRKMLNAFTGLISMWNNHGFEKKEDFDKFFVEYMKGLDEKKDEVEEVKQSEDTAAVVEVTKES